MNHYAMLARLGREAQSRILAGLIQSEKEVHRMGLTLERRQRGAKLKGQAEPEYSFLKRVTIRTVPGDNLVEAAQALHHTRRRSVTGDAQ